MRAYERLNFRSFYTLSFGLRRKRFQSSYSAKARISFFFLLSSQLSQRTRAETLAMQAISLSVGKIQEYS